MTKGLKYGALSVIASALISSAMAATLSTSPLTGTITGSSVTSKATELKATATISNMGFGVYIPTGISLTTLSNPTFNFGVQNGKLTLDTATKQYYVVEMTGTTLTKTDKIVGKYTAGSGYDAIAFGATGPQVSNNNKYVIVAASVTATSAPVDVAVDGTTDMSALNAAANTLSSDIAFDATISGTSTVNAVTGITYTQSIAASSDNLVVNLGQGDSQVISDRAMKSIMTSGVQLCAGVSQKASATIDPEDGFKSFQAAASAACGVTGTTSKTDTVKIKVRATEYINNAVGTTDSAVLTLHTDKALPAGTTASFTSTSVILPTACTVDTALTTVTCTSTGNINLTNFVAGIDDEEFAITLTVPGDKVIDRTMFTADAEYNFENFTALQADDYLKSLDHPLFAAADAGSWEYKGTTVSIPTMNSNDDTNTMIKLNNNSTVAARVFWTLIDDAGNVASMVEVPSSEGNTGLAAGTSNTWLASA
ncbi:MAG: hypothetical protein WCS55_07710, partial [Sulfuricurvum sp.]|uniref:hypothetical protein n=1 Tax=Sulfuricurvum sp. TaxID=2025608 RepID=UPI0035653AEE